MSKVRNRTKIERRRGISELLPQQCHLWQREQGYQHRKQHQGTLSQQLL